MLARLVFLAAEVGALVGFAWLVFSVPVRGSLLGLAAVSVVGACRLRRPRPARCVACPDDRGGVGPDELRDAADVGPLRRVLLVRALPGRAQPVIHALPLTALNDALRAVMLDGASLAGVSGELLILSAWAIVSFAIALRLFRWR